MSDTAEWLAALGQLERSLLAAWIAGPSLRDRWTPEPSQFCDLKTRALAAAAKACAAVGVDQRPDIQLVGILAASGDLKRFWPDRQDMWPVKYSTSPDADLKTWALLRIGFAAHQRLTELVSMLRPGVDLVAIKNGLLESIGALGEGTPIRTLTLEDVHASAHAAVGIRERTGYYTGIDELDKATGGLRPGHVWVLGAPTSWGKSSLLIAIANHHIRVHRKGVLIVTCEDDPDLLSLRWVVKRARVSGINARDACLTSDEHDRLVAEYAKSRSFGSSPVMLDGRGHSVEAICTHIKAICAAHSIKLVLVDYLQCMRGEAQTQDRRNEINHIARTMTDAIKTSGAAGLLASQLTGDDIRDSRDVEHAAEAVLIGRKNEDGSRTLFVKKNKTGPSGFDMALEWDTVTGGFILDKERQIEYDDWFDPDT